MPIFEFICSACDHRFEELLTAAELEDSLPVCPSCGSEKSERGLSAFATGSSTGAGSEPCGAPRGSCGSGGFT